MWCTFDNVAGMLCFAGSLQLAAFGVFLAGACFKCRAYQVQDLSSKSTTGSIAFFEFNLCVKLCTCVEASRWLQTAQFQGTTQVVCQASG